MHIMANIIENNSKQFALNLAMNLKIVNKTSVIKVYKHLWQLLIFKNCKQNICDQSV